VLVGLATVVGFISPSAASASHRDHRPGSYLALGDSIAYGYSPLLDDRHVEEGSSGYPEIIGARLHLVTTNLACPGQTAQALVSRDAVDNGCFDAREGFRDAGLPLLHTDYDGTQLEAALDFVRSDAPPSLITVQGGGNEWFECVLDNSDPTADPEQCLDENMPKVTESLREVVTRLRAAGYRGTLLLVGYHQLPGFEALFRPLNDAIERAARGAYVPFVDVAGPFDRYTRRHRGDACSTGLLIALPDGSCDLHPSPAGHAIYADAIVAAADGHGHHGVCSHHGDRRWSDHETHGERRRHGHHAR